MEKLPIHPESEEKLWAAVERQIPKLLLATTCDEDSMIPKQNDDPDDENGMTNNAPLDNYHLRFRRKGQKAVQVAIADQRVRRFLTGSTSRFYLDEWGRRRYRSGPGLQVVYSDELFYAVLLLNKDGKILARTLAVRRSAIDQRGQRQRK